jgi:hypothetical protein
MRGRRSCLKNSIFLARQSTIEALRSEERVRTQLPGLKTISGYPQQNEV